MVELKLDEAISEVAKFLGTTAHKINQALNGAQRAIGRLN